MLNEILILSMCLILLFGCCVSLLLSNYYKRMIIASENIGTTNDAFFKQLKLKYENLYKFQLDICNTQSFIKKQLYHLKYLNVNLYVWDSLLSTLKFLSAFIGSLYVYFSLTNNVSFNDLIPYVALTLLTYSLLSILAIYISSDIKKDILSTNLQEYLENYLNPRLAAQYDEGAAHVSNEILQKSTENSESITNNSTTDSDNKEVNNQFRQAANIISNDRTLLKETVKDRESCSSRRDSSNISGEPTFTGRGDIQLSEEVIEKILMEYL